MEHSYSQGLMEMRESGAMEISPGAAAEVPGDVYTCPLVMDDSCTIGPIGEIEFFSILFLFQRIAHTLKMYLSTGLPDMMSGTAIRHLTDSHGIPQVCQEFPSSLEASVH